MNAFDYLFLCGLGILLFKVAKDNPYSNGPMWMMFVAGLVWFIQLPHIYSSWRGFVHATAYWMMPIVAATLGAGFAGQRIGLRREHQKRHLEKQDEQKHSRNNRRA